MARVEITHDHVVHATPSLNLLYRAGTIVLAPRRHIAEIVAAGHGRAIDDPRNDTPPRAAEPADDHDDDHDDEPPAAA